MSNLQIRGAGSAESGERRKLLDIVKDSREVVAAIGFIVGATVSAMLYFAKNSEVEALRNEQRCMAAALALTRDQQLFNELDAAVTQSTKAMAAADKLRRGVLAATPGAATALLADYDDILSKEDEMLDRQMSNAKKVLEEQRARATNCAPQGGTQP